MNIMCFGVCVHRCVHVLFVAWRLSVFVCVCG